MHTVRTELQNTHFRLSMEKRQESATRHYMGTWDVHISLMIICCTWASVVSKWVHQVGCPKNQRKQQLWEVVKIRRSCVPKRQESVSKVVLGFLTPNGSAIGSPLPIRHWHDRFIINISRLNVYLCHTAGLQCQTNDLQVASEDFACSW